MQTIIQCAYPKAFLSEEGDTAAGDTGKVKGAPSLFLHTLLFRTRKFIITQIILFFHFSVNTVTDSGKIIVNFRIVKPYYRNAVASEYICPLRIAVFCLTMLRTIQLHGKSDLRTVKINNKFIYRYLSVKSYRICTQIIIPQVFFLRSCFSAQHLRTFGKRTVMFKILHNQMKYYAAKDDFNCLPNHLFRHKMLRILCHLPQRGRLGNRTNIKAVSDCCVQMEFIVEESVIALIQRLPEGRTFPAGKCGC